MLHLLARSFAPAAPSRASAATSGASLQPVAGCESLASGLRSIDRAAIDRDDAA
jgi:hypothetical protein